MRSSDRLLLIVCSILALLSAPSGAGAQKRLALVVGNNNYESVPKLDRAVNDAAAVGSALQSLGFQVSLARDVRRRDFIRHISAFLSRVEQGDFVLLYYAGHGVEIRGVNYVLPTDVPPIKEGEEAVLTSEAIATDKILSDVEARGAGTTVVVLDACRDNPFKNGGTRAVGGARGLAIEAPAEGVFLLYSAGVGQSALDRLSHSDADPNSVFTRVFLREMQKKDRSLIEMAKATQVAVRNLSQSVDHIQVPAYYDQIIGHAYLARDRAVTSDATPTAKSRPTLAPTTQTLQPASRPIFNNRAFTAYLGRPSEFVRAAQKWTNANPIASCDRLASYGPDVPDSRAPRVPTKSIALKDAAPACIAAVLQDSATPRLRAQLARALLQSPNKADGAAAIDILLDLAKDGYPAAMWRIGVSYYGGSLIKEDKKAAAFWFKEAAEKGLSVAMSDLAYLYTTGEGVPKDKAEAARWLERAAANGHPSGMRNYALVLDQGTGVERNAKRAAEYLLTAFRMGSESARKSLFELNDSWHADTKAELQELLAGLGFYTGRTDGVFNETTLAALNALQLSNPISNDRAE